jgi:nitrogen fixation/metabolism regulation signal transduction histidine kinase
MFEEGASTILEEVDQLSRLVGEFSEFARLPLPQCRRHSIAKILTESLDLFESTEMTIIREIDDDLYPVDVDAQQIAQVIKNIVGNATEASAGVAASTLTVRAFNHRESVELRFTDNGPGFPDGAEHRVFEPYFTTKETGTGLGMAISYRILSDHGGEIQAESEPQGGARITMRLPKA